MFLQRLSTQFLVLTLLGVAHAPGALADELPAPSPEAIQQVFNYYQKGSTALLTETITCARIGDVRPMRFECIDPIDLKKPLMRFSEAYFWTSLLAPVGNSGTLEYRFYYQGKLHTTSNVTVSPSLRYRVWKFLLTHMAGKWRVELVQITQQGEKRIAGISYQVQ